MTRVTLRLPDDLHQRLRAASRQRGASLNHLIIAALSEAVARDEQAASNESPLTAQVRQIRTVLGGLTVELAADRSPAHLRPDDDLPDRAAFKQSLPTLDPPLSATIIADREDRF